MSVTMVDRGADRRGDEALTAVGYQVVRITEAQVWYHPHEVVGALKAS